MSKEQVIQVRLLFFARAREIAGCDALELELPDGARLTDVVDRLCDQHPAIRNYVGHCRWSINEEFAPLEAPVPTGAEIALIPPVSGGI